MPIRSTLYRDTLLSTFLQHVPMKSFRPLLSLQCECKRSVRTWANTSKFLLHVGIWFVWMCAFSRPCPHSSQHRWSKEASDKTYCSHGLLLLLFPVNHWWVMNHRSIPWFPNKTLVKTRRTASHFSGGGISSDPTKKLQATQDVFDNHKNYSSMF